MSNETPGRDAVPGWGQPSPEPQPDSPTAPGPTQPEPAATPWPVETAAPVEPATTTWSTTPEPAPPAPVAPDVAPAAPAAAPVAPAAPTPWGAPPQAAPQPAPQEAPPAAWGAAPPAAWGTPPAQQQVPPQQPGPQQQPPGGWGAPPPQGGWAPGGPGAPGGPPVGWAPAPAKSGMNGCLKGCLIVGAIGFVLVIILGIAMTMLGLQFAKDMGINPDGTITECPIISSADASDALGGEATAMPLTGIVDATVGLALDKRVIPNAEDCWVSGASGTSTAIGRVARLAGGDASGGFRSAKAAAVAGAYFAGDVAGVGDEAFCTGMSEAASFGVLVRRGDTLAYVSLIDPVAAQTGYEANVDGVITSPDTCALAQEVARKVLR